MSFRKSTQHVAFRRPVSTRAVAHEAETRFRSFIPIITSQQVAYFNVLQIDPRGGDLAQAGYPDDPNQNDISPRLIVKQGNVI